MLETTPTFSDIKKAHERICGYIKRTPVFTCQNLDEMTGSKLFFKCENFQKVGAFKMRGASNAIFSYRPEDKKNGFACHSSGNHGQAVALASKLAGVPAYVVMPENSIQTKVDAVRSYGAQVTFCGSNDEAREKACAEIIGTKGATLIHPFNDYDIIAGQATASKEMYEDVDRLDIIMTPVGGGGLAAGTALTTRFLQPNTKVVFGEPVGADDTYRSFKKGKPQRVGTANTIADGLRTAVGRKNFEIIHKYADDVLTVTDDEIVEAMRLIWQRMKMVVEPSSAVPFAVVLKNKDFFAGRKVGIIISGGNVNLSNLPF